MNNARFLIAIGSFLVLLIFASSMALTQEADSARGVELLAPLKKDLKQALVAGMQKGPANAISVCKDQAPAITASLWAKGVEIGRTSHRLRNPDNLAPDWVDAVLQEYLGEETGHLPRVVSLADNREGYVEPITVKPLCLACHGESLAPGVGEQIKLLYPEDEATGFKDGDLRGVYWVEYPVVESRPINVSGESNDK